MSQQINKTCSKKFNWKQSEINNSTCCSESETSMEYVRVYCFYSSYFPLCLVHRTRYRLIIDSNAITFIVTHFAKKLNISCYFGQITSQPQQELLRPEITALRLSDGDVYATKKGPTAMCNCILLRFQPRNNGFIR